MAVGESTPCDDRKIITVCRPVDLATGLIESLEAEGFEVLSFPLAQVVDAADHGAGLEHAVDDLAGFAAVAFTSVNAVAAVRRVLGDRPWPTRTATFAVGRATGDAVTDAGFPTPFVPKTFTAAALGAQAPLVDSSRPILAPLAELASNDFEIAVAARGGTVERVTAYRTLVPSHPAHLIARVRQSDLVLVTSPSIVKRLVDALTSEVAAVDGHRRLPPVLAIGPRTATAAAAFAVEVVGVADPHNDHGLLVASRRYFTED